MSSENVRDAEAVTSKLIHHPIFIIYHKIPLLSLFFSNLQLRIVVENSIYFKVVQ